MKAHYKTQEDEENDYVNNLVTFKPNTTIIYYSEQPIDYKVKGQSYFRSLNNFRKDKKLPDRNTIRLSLALLLLAVVIYTVLRPPLAKSPYTREEYARITQETYNKTFEAINSMDLSESPTTHRKLLQIHIPCGPSELQRRSLIRTYQIEPYKNKYDIDFKFVIGEPDYLYQRALKSENDTYGDILIIPAYIDSREGARTNKTPEYYQYLESITAPGQEFRFIGRLDTDAYVDFDRIFAKYLNSTIQNTNTFAIITCWLDDLSTSKKPNMPNDWPQGSFYIFSWKMMLMYNRFYRAVPRELYYDDELMGRYLFDSQLKFTNVRIDGKESFDFGMKEWDRSFDNTTRIHELKDDKLYLRAAMEIHSNFTQTNTFL